jgi:hypothetical protein
MATLQYILSKTLKLLRTQNAYREAMLIHDWETIVGDELARGFSPIIIQTTSTSRVLRLQTSSSGMATARYVEPLLLERVNRFFGSPYISNIKTTQGQIKRAVRKPKPKAVIEPQTLEEALTALGQHLDANA